MFASFGIRKTVFAVMVSLATCTGCRAAAKVPAPPPANDTTLAQAPGQQTAVFAGGCFWGTQSVFERVKGELPQRLAMQAVPLQPPPTARSQRRRRATRNP
jgi:hypothetical protein